MMLRRQRSPAQHGQPVFGIRAEADGNEFFGQRGVEKFLRGRGRRGPEALKSMKIELRGLCSDHFGPKFSEPKILKFQKFLICAAIAAAAVALQRPSRAPRRRRPHKLNFF